MKLDMTKEDFMVLINLLTEVYERNIVRHNATKDVIKKEILTKQNKFIEKMLSKRRD